jgi:predicted AlkP superfamily pyrophosphatase or phosphodiesterase
MWLYAVMVAAVFGAPPITPAQEKAAPLLVMISVDGLRSDYVTAADAHSARVPNLRRFLTEGAYAEGVTGVVPTVTYPSHTTLVTGV